MGFLQGQGFELVQLLVPPEISAGVPTAGLLR
jgi:hypothetical protein